MSKHISQGSESMGRAVNDARSVRRDFANSVTAGHTVSGQLRDLTTLLGMMATSFFNGDGVSLRK